MSLLAELKRRNVIRMAGLYLVGAWLLTQVASTVFPAFDVPGWALRGLIIVLVIGFVPALVFAWDDISTFYTFDAAKDTKDAFDRSPYRQRIRRIIPHAVQQAIRAGCGDVLDEIANVVAFKPDCKLDVSDAEIAAAAAELVNDPNVFSDLRLHFSTMIAAVNNVSGDVVLLQRAVASFDEKARRTIAGAKP